MNPSKSHPIHSLFLALLFLFLPSLPHDGSATMAKFQFQQAKEAYQRQELYRCQRLALLASANTPSSAAPHLLVGHCFYLQGLDSAALSHYCAAQRLNPDAGNLPPFFEALRQRTMAPMVLDLTPRDLARLRRKIGQMILVCVPGTELSGQKKQLIRDGCIGGIILFGQNVQTKKQVKAYVEGIQRISPVPLFVGVDQEGGAVRRFREEHGFQTVPSMAALGARKDPDLAYRFGRVVGRQLREVGVNLNFSPVVDLDHGLPDSIITKYRRSLGSDPQLVSALAERIVEGMRKERIIATAKHFPTQSAALLDTHRGVAHCDQPLSEMKDRDLLPYRRLIAKGLDAVMLSHVIYRDIDPYFPASLSQETIQNLLRGKMGFQGLVISDDLRMDAIKGQYPLEISVVQAVSAGSDLLVITDNLEKRVLDILTQAVTSGRIPMGTVDAAYARILETKRRYGISPGAPRAVGVQQAQANQKQLEIRN